LLIWRGFRVSQFTSRRYSSLSYSPPNSIGEQEIAVLLPLPSLEMEYSGSNELNTYSHQSENAKHPWIRGNAQRHYSHDKKKERSRSKKYH
jgi:hypothetical protein